MYININGWFWCYLPKIMDICLEAHLIPSHCPSESFIQYCSNVIYHPLAKRDFWLETSLKKLSTKDSLSCEKLLWRSLKSTCLSYRVNRIMHVHHHSCAFHIYCCINKFLPRLKRMIWTLQNCRSFGFLSDQVKFVDCGVLHMLTVDFLQPSFHPLSKLLHFHRNQFWTGS